MTMNNPSDRSPDILLQNARSALASGQLTIADFLAQDVLDTEPGNAQALALLGEVAIRLGLAPQGVSFLRRALAQPKAPPETRALLHSAEEMQAAQAQGRKDGLILIKAWGAGFWADVTHVLGGLLLAEVSGRQPVTLWGSNSLYNDGSEADAFRLYFEPLSKIEPDDLAELAGADIYPDKWVGSSLFLDNHQKFSGRGSCLPGTHLLARPEFLVVTDFHFGIPDLIHWIPVEHHLHGKPIKEIFRYLIGKYLRPSARVKDSLEALDREFDLSSIELAVHVRGTDKAAELAVLGDMNAYYFSAMEKLYRGGRILLLTEDDRLVSAFTDRFGDKVVLPRTLRQVDGTPPHVMAGGDRTRLGVEAARDAYAVTRVKKFLGNGFSNLSGMAWLLRESTVNAFLIGGVGLFQRSSLKFTYRKSPE